MLGARTEEARTWHLVLAALVPAIAAAPMVALIGSQPPVSGIAASLSLPAAAVVAVLVVGHRTLMARLAILVGALVLAVPVGAAVFLLGYLVSQPFAHAAGYHPDGYAMVPGAILLVLPLASAIVGAARRAVDSATATVPA